MFKTGMKVFGIFLAVMLTLSGLGIVYNMVTAPLEIAATAVSSTKSMAKGVIKQTLNADNALDKYRKFHNLYQGMVKHQANYSLYVSKVTDYKGQYEGVPYPLWPSADKEQFNFLKDTQSNFKLAYNRNAAKYNELASRVDAKFFKSVDYLPLLGLDEPLPDYVEYLE